MNFAALSPVEARALLVGFLSTGFAILLTRAIILFRRKRAGFHPIYPPTWNLVQCRALERFRLLVGLALIPLWVTFFCIASSIRTDWAYGHLGQFLFGLLLWISDAWVLLLVPRNWQTFGVISRSFWIVMAFLVVWWGTVFTATGWMLAKASTTPLGLYGPYGAQYYSLSG